MQYKQGQLEVKLGNKKIGNDTLIFNMGSAAECPSKSRGFCKLGKKCNLCKETHQNIVFPLHKEVK